jgi:hypothetical protein
MDRRQKVKTFSDGTLAARIRGHKDPRPEKGRTARHSFLWNQDHHERFILVFALLLLLAIIAFSVLMRIRTVG